MHVCVDSLLLAGALDALHLQPQGRQAFVGVAEWLVEQVGDAGPYWAERRALGHGA